MEYQRTSHAVYECKYHLVWAPKYRKMVLSEPVARRCKEVFQETAERHGFEIVEQEVMPDHFQLPALTVAQLDKARWQIERFFKWIKPHLRIKAFYGTSANAVKTHVWMAITGYVLVAIIKKRLRLQVSLDTLLQLLSVTLFEKVPLGQLVTQTALTDEPQSDSNQLMLFE